MSLEDRELIDCYLANRLDEAGRESVEQRLLVDSSFRREAELTEQLRAGLRELQARRELAAAAADASRFWERPAFALAASVAAISLGILSTVLYAELQRTRSQVSLIRGGASVAALVTNRVSTLPLVGTRSASGAPDATWRRPTQPELLELHIDPGIEPAPTYRLTLQSVSGDRVATLLQAPAIAPSTNGDVVLAINSAQLQPGDYVLRLERLQATGEDGLSEYRLRVTE